MQKKNIINTVSFKKGVFVKETVGDDVAEKVSSQNQTC